MTRQESGFRVRTPIASALAALALIVPVAAAAPVPGDPAVRALVARALGETPLVDDLRELCDRIGGRPTGSPALDRAVDWAAAKFRAAGVESVTLETFTVPGLWLGDRAEAACVAPVAFPFRLAAAPYAPSTPAGGLEAPLVDAGAGTAADFEKLGAGARGAIALVRSAEMRTFDDLFAEYMKNAPMIAAAKSAGMAALLLQSTRPRGLLYRHPISIHGEMAPFPVAIVSREGAERLGRLLAEPGGQPPRVRLDLANRTGGAYEAKNVVAEIRGREKPDEIVLLGAHLDSWDLGTGEEDNGVNAALVLDVARAFRELGIVPRRTVRFVLFSGEEQGLFGSSGYVKRHGAEMDGHVAAIVFDTGSGHTSGFYLDGRDELRRPLDAALAPVAALGPFTHRHDGIDGTDNFDFLLAGVPNFVADQDPIPYLPDYHAESDVFERLNAREARASAAIAAALVYGLAEAKERPGRRQSRAEVDALLKETRLDQQMKAFGQWEEWISGKSGARP
ncbi:MAG: M28 family peptidase [Acidobacteria bacterium]|nr:M28 family peptidase [Acidobacteriota bacterium]